MYFNICGFSFLSLKYCLSKSESREDLAVQSPCAGVDENSVLLLQIGRKDQPDKFPDLGSAELAQIWLIQILDPQMSYFGKRLNSFWPKKKPVWS